MKIVAVTACPSGVAHTYMAAEAIERAAKKNGHTVKVETQGSVGTENVITSEDLKGVDFVILTKDIAIKNAERFKDYKVVKVKISDAVKKATQLIAKLETLL